ncbi:hypothetical protein ACO0OL_000905 [Hanseniaspora opuntiae]
MANKRRPKKTVVPYRKYVAGVGYVTNTKTVKEFSSLNGQDPLFDEYMEDLSTDISSVNINSKTNSNHVLPMELYAKILDYAIDFDNDEDFNPKKRDQETKAKIVYKDYALVCKAFYYLMIPRLYNTPHLTSKNFLKFIQVLDSDKKMKRNIKKNKDDILQPYILSDFVNTLDLSMIIQSGKNSIISKLLRRCSANLVEFIAPQTSFGMLSLTTLKSCYNLEVLNLQLVAEKVDLNELFPSLNKFKKLKSLALPRSSFNCDLLAENYTLRRISFDNDAIWPPNLEDVTLSGNLTNDFINICFMPVNLKKLTISHCALLDDVSIYKILDRCGNTLESIHFQYPLTKLRNDSLDNVLRYCSSSLKEMSILADNISKYFFLDETHFAPNLETMNILCSGSLSQLNKIHPDDITIALVENRFPSLKTLNISMRIGWDMNSDDIEDLITVFEDQGGSIYMSY